MERVLGLLGGQDPLEVQAGTPDRLRSIVAGVEGSRLRHRAGPGRWSALDVIQHLADTELVNGYRIRTVLARDGSRVAGFDQDAWVEALRYEDVDLEEALQEFEACRGANLRLIRRIDPSLLQRCGDHAERGRESVAAMLRIYAGHDLLHLEQIQRILDDLQG